MTIFTYTSVLIPRHDLLSVIKSYGAEGWEVAQLISVENRVQSAFGEATYVQPQIEVILKKSQEQEVIEYCCDK